MDATYAINIYIYIITIHEYINMGCEYCYPEGGPSQDNSALMQSAIPQENNQVPIPSIEPDRRPNNGSAIAEGQVDTFEVQEAQLKEMENKVVSK